MDKKTIDELRAKLQEQKKFIQKELEGFARKDNVPKGDWETKYPNREDRYKDEEANEVEDYDNLLPVEHSLELKLKDIDNALQKIEKGEYGMCEKCGKKIEEERLKAVPEAKSCMKHNK